MSFPLMSDLKRRVIRAPENPMDRSTVVSIFNKHIVERKPTLQPGEWELMPGTYENPYVLVVGSSSWWKEVGEDQPLLEIPQSSVVIAESIVRDYCNGIFGCDMGENMPGLFFIPGAHTAEEVKMRFPHMLNEANRKQRNWFGVLVKQADSDWARSNGNSLAISEIQRMAARELNLIDREWIKDIQQVNLVRCPACGQLKNPEYPVCPNCHAITDVEKAEKLGIKFAK